MTTIPPISRYFTERDDMRPKVPHYQSGGIEPIDFINSHNFNFNITFDICCVQAPNRKTTKGGESED